MLLFLFSPFAGSCCDRFSMEEHLLDPKCVMSMGLRMREEPRVGDVWEKKERNRTGVVICMGFEASMPHHECKSRCWKHKLYFFFRESANAAGPQF